MPLHAAGPWAGSPWSMRLWACGSDYSYGDMPRHEMGRLPMHPVRAAPARARDQAQPSGSAQRDRRSVAHRALAGIHGCRRRPRFRRHRTHRQRQGVLRGRRSGLDAVIDRPASRVRACGVRSQGDHLFAVGSVQAAGVPAQRARHRPRRHAGGVQRHRGRAHRCEDR